MSADEADVLLEKLRGVAKSPIAHAITIGPRAAAALVAEIDWGRKARRSLERLADLIEKVKARHAP